MDNVKTLGVKADPRDWYTASKTLAEKAAWDFVKTEKPSFDLVTVLPSLVSSAPAVVAKVLTYSSSSSLWACIRL